LARNNLVNLRKEHAMLYVKNLPMWERSLRIGGGAAVAIYAFLYIGGAPGWIIAAGGVGAALTGVLGFCPACALAGRRLAKRDPQG
jgi:hypothetical protein